MLTIKPPAEIDLVLRHKMSFVAGTVNTTALAQANAKLDRKKMKQLTIFDWIEDRDKPRKVDCIGLMDDAICSECGYVFLNFDSMRFGWKSEIGIDRCPNCQVKLDWTRWHKVNDKEAFSNE